MSNEFLSRYPSLRELHELLDHGDPTSSEEDDTFLRGLVKESLARGAPEGDGTVGSG
jgi:hypothetical protein